MQSVTHTVKGSRNVRRYAVKGTGGTRVRAYVDALFDETEKPLCSLMKSDTGTENPDCGKSTAYTTWSHKVVQKQLYNAEGKKQKLVIHYDTQATLPHWDGVIHAEKHDAAEARRADLRTAYHEAGHQNTPIALTAAILRFADAMPDAISRTDVNDYNMAVQCIIDNFYSRLGHTADTKYDGGSGHGQLTGSIYSDVPITSPAPEHNETPLLP